MPKPYFNNIDSIIRVNHAGEYAASIIYKTQLGIVKDPALKEEVKEMYETELKHLKYFSDQMHKLNVRPTFMLGVWHLLSYILAKITAELGEKYVFLATEAVEEVIDNHYLNQLDMDDAAEYPELFDKIAEYRQDEIEHKNTATASIGKLNIFDRLLKGAIQHGCRKAIDLSKIL